MKIAILKETKPDEKRVALSPTVAGALTKAGYEILIESGAGNASSFEDSVYQTAGATVVADKAALIAQADVVAKVNPWNDDEVATMKSGQVALSILFHLVNTDLVKKLADKGVSAFSMDAIPRISKAQSMDVLSSQSNLAGYKAVLLGANEMTKIFPMLMTAAGTVTPAKVLIFGIGVAGLQAIATAKRLGAQVEATDVRPETKEQAESLGAKFIEVKSEGAKAEGGYAKEVSEEYQQKQKEAVNKSLSMADLVITTALIPGRPAPKLITEEQVKLMKYGSVIVDMAAEQGGNCALCEAGKNVVKHGVTIVGATNLPSTLATNASELYAKNLSTFLQYLATKDGFKWELEEEITKGTLITHGGAILRS
ncbi:MAG: Re/Si-specific NAD(P)(+) transhydrogenase subunit alpha [Flavobacteriaceae bacterium]|nr:Re/Si-specific NAD(P)(+) transhydrogenase subunit alpha [Flavobacteriaceae bacterium]